MKTNPFTHHSQNSVISFARGRLLPSGIFAALLLLALTAFSVRASDPNGIYAYVDKVVLLPNDTAPESIQIFGGFALAKGKGDEYTSAEAGYVFYKLDPAKTELCRTEWADLKKLAGTGQMVSFGGRYKTLGTVRKADSKAENPDTYPLGWGINKVKASEYKPIKELQALKATSPTDNKKKSVSKSSKL